MVGYDNFKAIYDLSSSIYGQDYKRMKKANY